MKLKKYRLADIGKVITGKTPSTSIAENYACGNIPFYTPEDVAKGLGMMGRNNRFISQTGFEEIASNTISGESVLVGCIGSDMGNVAYSNITCATNQQINSITQFKNGAEPLYVYYLLSTMKPYFQKIAGSTTTPILPKSVFEEIEIYLPGIKYQKDIVSILYALDRKIALNHQINDNLEAMAKQLYDCWFVQFDFPNEEGKPYKSSGGAMVWNEKLKREIPKGWSVKNLEQIATSYQQGLIRSNNQLSTDSKYGYLKMGDLDGKGQYTLQGLTRTNATNEEVDLFSLHKGDFLINVRNSKEIVGKTCLIGYVERNTLYNHMLVRLDFKDVSTFYMNLLFNSEFMYKALDGLKQGTTTVIALYQNDLYRLPILVPAPCVMEQFSKITDSILDQKEIISYEIEELTKQRDDLLPLLMNGQATVNYHLFVMQSRLSSYRRLHPFYVLLYTFCVSV